MAVRQSRATASSGTSPRHLPTSRRAAALRRFSSEAPLRRPSATTSTWRPARALFRASLASTPTMDLAGATCRASQLLLLPRARYWLLAPPFRWRHRRRLLRASTCHGGPPTLMHVSTGVTAAPPSPTTSSSGTSGRTSGRPRSAPPSQSCRTCRTRLAAVMC